MTEKAGKRVTFGDQKVKADPAFLPPARLFPPDGKPDRPTEVQVAETYSLLTSRISQLGDKVEHILAVHEKDFMSAFRAHMFQVQKQLVELKKRVDEGEMRLRRDEHIVRLETALGRLQEAALDLEKSEKEARKEKEDWKGKAEEALAEREFLEKQVVVLMRQATVVKDSGESSALPPLRPSPPHSSRDSPFPTAPFTPKSDFGRWLDTLSKKHQIAHTDFLSTIETHFLLIKSQFDSSLAHLRNTINDLKRSIRSLQTNTSTFATERSELESIFLDCVDEVKREIAIRRNLSDARTVSKFENRDKGKVMELLFSNDKLLGYLYEKMFRSTGLSGRESMMDRGEGESKSEQELLRELTAAPGGELPQANRRSKSSSSGKGKRKDLVVLDGKLMLAR